MSYLIFLKNSDNIEGKLYKIAENQSDLNNLNLIQSDYKIIEDSQYSFEIIKSGSKFPNKYNNNTITYLDVDISFQNKQGLQNYIDKFKNQIKEFTVNNPNHPLFNLWNNYYNQLNSLNLDNITYPLNKSLEQYYSDLGQPSFNPLQLP
jgi:hypothetical protein